MTDNQRPHRDPYEDPATEPDLVERCSMCHGPLWADGLAPVQDGNGWICGDCDQARNFEALDL